LGINKVGIIDAENDYSFAVYESDYLIVDDVCDTGETFTKLRKRSYVDFNTVVLVNKPWSTYKVNCFGMETNDWVVFPWEK
jgi:hypoxanthine-guanine phosphoribosyltransferase